MPYTTDATPDAKSPVVESPSSLNQGPRSGAGPGTIDFSGLSAALLNRSGELLPAWFPAGELNGHEYQVGSLRGEAGSSLSINLNTGKWADFAEDAKGGDLISLYAACQGIKQSEAAKRLARDIGFNLCPNAAMKRPTNDNGSNPKPAVVKPPVGTPPPSMHHFEHGEPSRSWCYREADGEPLFYVARYDVEGGKQFSPWSWDGFKWIAKGWAAPRPLHGLDLLAQRPDARVLIVEGEKAADAARDMVGDTYVVVTWPFGAKAVDTVDWSPLRGRSVLVWPDADEAGIAAGQQIAAKLAPDCPEVKVIDVLIGDSLPPGYDAADALEDGWSLESFEAWSSPLARMIKRSPEVSPNPDGTDDGGSGERPNVTPLYRRDAGTLLAVDLSTVPEPPPTPMLFGGRLAANYPNSLYGGGGQGKSLFALALASAAVAGKRFCGLDLPNGPVLYLDWELSQDGQAHRAYQIARGLGLEAPPKGLLYLAPTNCLPKLIDQTADLIEREKPVLVIVDSMGPASGGSPEDAEETITLFNAIRRFGVSSLILDHQSKTQQGQDSRQKTIFGSVYKFNLSRSVIQLERIASAPGELRLLLRHTKSNFGPYVDDLALLARFSRDTVKFEMVDQTTDPAYAKVATVAEKILSSLLNDGPATSECLADRINEALKTVKNQVTQLRKANRIEESGKQNRQALWDLRKMNVPSSQLYIGGTRDAQVGASEEIKVEVPQPGCELEPSYE